MQAVYYRESDGSEPVRVFLDNLETEERAVLDLQIDRLNMLQDGVTGDARYRRTFEQLLPYERIARLVIGLRLELGISQDELARRVGTSGSAIARLESGQHRPSVETLRRVADAMGRELVISFGEVRSPDRKKRETIAADHPEAHPVLA